MYSSSAKFGELIQQDSRTFSAKLLLDGVEISGSIKSIKITGGSNSASDFSIGSVMSQYVDITMTNPGVQLEGKEMLLQIGMEVDGELESIPMGLFTAEKPKTDENTISFTAYDRMMKLEKGYFSSLSDQTNTVAVLQEIGSQIGITIETTGLQAFSITKPVGYTCREVLGYISQMYGGFAVCNRSGVIVIRTYESSEYIISTGRYWETFTHNDYVFLLDQITCITGKNDSGENISITAGSGPRRIVFSNPFMTQDILNSAWEVLRAFSYMPGHIKFLGDPRIDPWDVVTIRDLNGNSFRVPAMTLIQAFDGGLTTEITAVGKSESEQALDYKGPKTSEMDRYYAQLVLIDHALVNKLDAEEARITYASIQNLEATEAKVENLSAHVGQFEELTTDNLSAIDAEITRLKSEDITALNAGITNLDAAYANIATIMNGNAGIGSLQNIHLTSQNAVIDSALINTILANNAIVNQLISGKIITDNVEVTSADGSVSLKGSTQTFKDGNGNVRLQLGQDALGNFTFVLYDESGTGVMMDSTGIKESAIGNGLIKDSMVASNAGIQASKLDIQSLFREINGSSLTLNSSRIWFDEGGQSLNQVYSQVQSNTTLIGENTAAAAEASTKAQAAQAAAEQALDAISGISTLTGFVVTLSNDAHVVHTLHDGSGGDYTEAYTIIKAYLGDTDVSDHTTFTALPSSSVHGTWNANTRTYQVTDLTDEDGYVDFQCAYGHDHIYLVTRSGANLQTRSGNNLTMRSGSATISKRFSISKSPDGKIGTSYKIQCSTEIIRKDTEGLIPESVTFSAMYNDGIDMRDYTGRYKIEESTDGSTYTQTYYSESAELMKVYVPSSQNVVAIRCTLFSADGTQKLDVQVVTVLIDAQGILEDFEDLQLVVQQNEETVTTYTQAVDRLGVQFEHLESTVIGYSDGRLLYQTPSTDNGDGTVTVRARVYKDGVDATSEFPSRWFTWKIRTEEGTVEAPNGYHGYSTIVPKDMMGFGGVVIGRFATYTDGYLLTRSGANLCTRSGNRLVAYDLE